MTDETRETLTWLLRDMEEPGTVSYDDDVVIAALRDVLTPRTCGTCRHDGQCGIQGACVSSQSPSLRATGCIGAWQSREGEGGTR